MRRISCSKKAPSVEQIDRALTEFGLPVGPFGMQDIAGIDVGARIRQYLASIGKTRAEGPQSADSGPTVRDGALRPENRRRLVQVRRAGQPQPDRRIPSSISSRTEAATKRGITRRPIADEEIVARITTALANEGARVLEEGYATRAGDIDIIYVYGFGFPRHRGGPMFYADTVGLDTVLARVQGVPRAVRRLLGAGAADRALVAEGRGFYSGDGARSRV